MLLSVHFSLWKSRSTFLVHITSFFGTCVSQREDTNAHALAQVSTNKCHRMLIICMEAVLPDLQHDSAGEHDSVDSTSTRGHAVGRRTAAKACSTETARATAVAEASHSKGSQGREVWRQRTSQLERRHQSEPAFYVYILVHTVVDFVVKMKNRIDPEAEINQIGATLRALGPTFRICSQHWKCGKTSSGNRKSQELSC